jgi:hypothetical protein
MMPSLPALPYGLDALAPHFWAEAQVHHRAALGGQSLTQVLLRARQRVQGGEDPAAGRSAIARRQALGWREGLAGRARRDRRAARATSVNGTKERPWL